MKILVIILLLSLLGRAQVYEADGYQLFPLVVKIVDEEGELVEGVEIAPVNRKSPGGLSEKISMEFLKIQKTNVMGLSFLYIFVRWGGDPQSPKYGKGQAAFEIKKPGFKDKLIKIEFSPKSSEDVKVRKIKIEEK